MRSAPARGSCHSPRVFGSWLGYVYVLAGCALVLVLLGGSVLALYALARIRGRGQPRVRVVTVGRARPRD